MVLPSTVPSSGLRFRSLVPFRLAGSGSSSFFFHPKPVSSDSSGVSNAGSLRKSGSSSFLSSDLSSYKDFLEIFAEIFRHLRLA